MKFDTKETITWCPGCSNFGILNSTKDAFQELVKEGKVKSKDLVTITGIGCASKIYDYLNTNGIYCLHGRNIPVSIGVKMGNPSLKVISFGGDGDTYTEGSAHFLHACRYNVDMTLIVHSNQVFALTTGQATPISESNFKGKSTPLGVFGEQLNPAATALVNGATFVARSYALDPDLKNIIKKAINHKGYALIDLLCPCVTFNRVNTFQWYKENSYYLDDSHDSYDQLEAIKIALDISKLALGVLYKNPNRRPYHENVRIYNTDKRPLYQRDLDKEKFSRLLESYR